MMMMINCLEMDSFVLSQQSNRGITDDVKTGDHRGDNVAAAVFSPTSSSEVSSVVSSEDSDLFEEVNSSPSSDSSSTSSPTMLESQSTGPLQDMSSLLQELPFKRGLSKHYNGKSQSFTSLANVRSLEDLAKPENPYNKKLKSCKSYGGLLGSSHGGGGASSSSRGNSSLTSRLIQKKATRGGGGYCSSSLCIKRNSSFLGNRPPIPPPTRSTSTSSFTNSQTPLFALGI